MTDNFFNQDFDFVDESQAELVLPPLIQWHRGDLQNTNAALKNGCFQLPVERYSLDGVEPVDVLHGVNVIPSYVFSGLSLAILAWRKDWLTGRGKESRLQLKFDANVPAWSRIQVWAMVKQLDNAQFVLTFSRSNSMGIEEAIKQFRSTVIGAASQKARKNFPLYSFWCQISADQPKKFEKEGTYATPPKLALSGAVNDEMLAKLFVGRELVEAAAAAYPAAKEWATRKAQQQQPAVDADEMPGIPPFDEGEPQMGDNDEIPW